MTHDQYLAAKDLLLRTAEDIESSKRPAYTIGSEDVLANFKRIAERTGQEPGQVLATYMLKHVDAVTSALCRPDLPQAEAILGRFADLINYAKLGYALVVERGEKLRDDLTTEIEATTTGFVRVPDQCAAHHNNGLRCEKPFGHNDRYHWVSYKGGLTWLNCRRGMALALEHFRLDIENGLVDQNGDRIVKKTCACGETDTCANCPPHVQDAVKAAEQSRPLARESLYTECESLYTEDGRTYRCFRVMGHSGSHSGTCVSGAGFRAQWCDAQAIDR